MWWTALRIQQVCNITYENPCPAGFLSSASVNQKETYLRTKLYISNTENNNVLGIFLSFLS